MLCRAIRRGGIRRLLLAIEQVAYELSMREAYAIAREIRWEERQ